MFGSVLFRMLLQRHASRIGDRRIHFVDVKGRGRWAQLAVPVPVAMITKNGKKHVLPSANDAKHYARSRTPPEHRSHPSPCEMV